MRIHDLGHDKYHDELLKKYAGNLSIHQVYWLDQDGREIYNWITDINIPVGIFATIVTWKAPSTKTIRSRRRWRAR